MHIMHRVLSTLNSKKKYIVSILLMLAAVAVGIVFVNRVFMRDGSRFKYKPFFENDTEYDVLFFGTSHVINGIFPMQLWKDYGITSYNFGGHGNSIATSYWVLVNACKYHKPKVAVLDVLGAGSSYASMNVSQSHISLDTFALSSDKIRAASDIFADNKQYRNEIISPLIVYHNRWTELSENMIKAGVGIYDGSKEMGAESRIAVAKPDEMTLIPQTDMLKEETVGLSYIKKFIDYCRAEGIEPVIINIPYPAPENSQQSANAAIKLGRSNGVPSINFQYEGIVDFDTDLYDPNSHLNPSGARKITEYLGEFLSQNYKLKDKRTDPDYQDWHAYYEEYRTYISDKIKNAEDYKISLMLLNNENFRAELTVTPEHDIENADIVEQKLIAQLGDNITLSVAPDISTDDGKEADIKLDIYDAVTGEKIAAKYFKTDSVDTLVKKE